MEFTVVGLPYYGFEKIKHLILVGEELDIEWDRFNKHSEHAMQANYRGVKIGYLSGRESQDAYNMLVHGQHILKFKIKEIRQSCIKVVATAIPAIDKTTKAEYYVADRIDDDDLGAVFLNDLKVKPETNQVKEEKMFDKIVSTNAAMANSAAFLEAGRIANNTAAKFVASKSPLMVRGYVDTAFGKLLIANAAAVAAEKFRPADKKLARLANAMITEAYQEVYQLVDIEKMLNEMLSSDSVKAALAKLEVVDASGSVE